LLRGATFAGSLHLLAQLALQVDEFLHLGLRGARRGGDTLGEEGDPARSQDSSQLRASSSSWYSARRRSNQGDTTRSGSRISAPRRSCTITSSRPSLPFPSE
jgi:hypothetical protein